MANWCWKHRFDIRMNSVIYIWSVAQVLKSMDLTPHGLWILLFSFLQLSDKINLNFLLVMCPNLFNKYILNWKYENTFIRCIIGYSSQPLLVIKIVDTQNYRSSDVIFQHRLLNPWIPFFRFREDTPYRHPIPRLIAAIIIVKAGIPQYSSSFFHSRYSSCFFKWWCSSHFVWVNHQHYHNQSITPSI